MGKGEGKSRRAWERIGEETLSIGEKTVPFRPGDLPGKFEDFRLPAGATLLNSSAPFAPGGQQPAPFTTPPHYMARIFGIEIPNEKRIEASLTYLYGIGPTTARKILEQAGVDSDLRTGQLSEEHLVKIAQVIQGEGIAIEGDLRREKQAALKRLTSINCYRGQRHKRGLPVRGQRTRTNSRTRKGRKKTVGAKK